MSRIGETVRALGEERFRTAMEEISSAERREIFAALGVPRGGAAASARQRTARRIRAAWSRLGDAADDEAAERFARHWLARNRMAMISEFLDRLEVEHEGGYMRDEDALATIPRERLAEGLKSLMGRHEPVEVRLYAALMELPEPDGAA